MTPWQARFRFPLYLRIWLAVVVAVMVLTSRWLGVARQRGRHPRRDVVIRREAGTVRRPGESAASAHPGPRHRVRGGDERRQYPGGAPAAKAARARRSSAGPTLVARPGSLLWILSLVALAVALGTYPIIRRLTRRLDVLQQGVEQWGEGDLSTRVRESGADEVTFLAARFNHAAERVETLVKSHQVAARQRVA